MCIFEDLVKSAPVNQCLHPKIGTGSDMVKLEEGISVSHRSATVEILKGVYFYDNLNVSLGSLCVCMLMSVYVCTYCGSALWMHVSVCTCTSMCAHVWIPEVNTSYLP